MEKDIIKNTQNKYFIPSALVISGALIAGAILLSNSNIWVENKRSDLLSTQKTSQSVSTNNVRAVTDEDHIKGNPNAPVKIVEYSDFECQFCKRLHKTMNEIMDEIGDSGEVAWVYRQFPIEAIHPIKARAESVASECSAELGGNDAFWKFADRFMELTPSSNKTNIEVVIPQIVREIGLDEEAFNACYESDKYDSHIDDDIANAIATGGQGTPWSIVIAPNGKTFPINGAQPKEAIMQLIKLASQEK